MTPPVHPHLDGQRTHSHPLIIDVSGALSDTTVLASLGAGSDHMDHVITQLPYALSMAGLTFLIYVLV